VRFEIPEHRLPPGFADRLESPPPRPAPPAPAATLILLRDATAGLEVLLLRRNRSSGFVPGAWVFPGGRVDAADSGPALHERIRGLPDPPTPGSAWWCAALRELFEETGVLLARTPAGAWAPDASTHARTAALRHALLDDQASLQDVLEELDLVLDARDVVHFAHWVTPVVEPRRFDTHFFAAALPPGLAAAADPREMSQSAWLTPPAALARFEQGTLPMVFPTVKTLQRLAGYDDARHALEALRGLPVPTILPRLVRTPTGVAIVVDE
jgi:8-oxo-dGTP pyrophosphatase MutT (NUDIX family)